MREPTARRLKTEPVQHTSKLVKLWLIMATTTIHTHCATSRAEPAIAWAQQHLDRGDVSGAHTSMLATLNALRMLGPVKPVSQSLVHALAPFTSLAKVQGIQVDLHKDAQCKIDASAVTATLHTAIENVALSGDAVLICNLDAEASPPELALVLDGPGAFPDTWFIGGMIPVSFDELRAHWTRHTAGGRLDRTTNGMTFKFTGQREPQSIPVAEGEAERIAEAIPKLQRVVSSEIAPTPELGVVRDLLEFIDARDADKEPADIAAMLRSLYEGERGFVLTCSPNIPPIALRRERFLTALQRLCELAHSRVAAGASIELNAQYDSRDRALEIEASFPKDAHDMAWHAASAALARVVEDVHDGSMIRDVSDDTCAVSLTIPDSVGLALNEWIPEFEVLSDRSVQMLRLLKSGGQAPPEEIILPGVMESELERWLLDKLEAAPAVNVAHELEKGSGNAPRLDKALSQIRRGKPKKEICAPPYAAEIVRAYAASERGRKALGLDALSEKEIETLLDTLTSEPPGYLECLRLLVKITRAA